jgi:hypothetical protein
MFVNSHGLRKFMGEKKENENDIYMKVSLVMSRMMMSSLR